MANKSIKKEEQENIKELFLKFQETRDKKTRDTLVEKTCISLKYWLKNTQEGELNTMICTKLHVLD